MRVLNGEVDASEFTRKKFADLLCTAILGNGMSLVIIEGHPSWWLRWIPSCQEPNTLRKIKLNDANLFVACDVAQKDAAASILLKIELWHSPYLHIVAGKQLGKILEQANVVGTIKNFRQCYASMIDCEIDVLDNIFEFYGEEVLIQPIMAQLT